MSYTKSPCFGCTERTAECHAVCEPYKEYEEIHKRETDEVFRRRVIALDCDPHRKLSPMLFKSRCIAVKNQKVFKLKKKAIIRVF